jgi:hypothetical protein
MANPASLSGQPDDSNGLDQQEEKCMEEKECMEKTDGRSGKSKTESESNIPLPGNEKDWLE